MLLPVATAQPVRQSLRDQIERVYDRWNALTAAGDAGGLIRMLHDDFSYTDAKGHVERRPAFDNRLRESFQRSRNLNNSATILKVEGVGNRATAWTIYGVKMEYLQGTAWIAVAYKLKTQDTFVRRRGSWVLLTSKVLPD